MNSLETVLRAYQDPYLGMDLISAKACQLTELAADPKKLTLTLGFPAARYQSLLSQRLVSLFQEQHLPIIPEIAIQSVIKPHRAQSTIPHIPGIKNIIAVASGKGGVGKSTTAVNLAIALQQEGASVGILDADIYGPNQPHMLGVQRPPESEDGKHMHPVISHGIQSMSIGYLIEQETPMIWRGPMVTSALQQLLNETLWDNLDYLIMDLPPGTGDIQLTMAQKIPVTGAVIVTTPQDIALLDARKATKMFQKVNVPVLGVVENMGMHVCQNCGTMEAIFGEDGGKNLAEQYGLPFLGTLPLQKQIRELADRGMPIVAALPESATANLYREIALKISAQIALLPIQYGANMPKVVIAK